MSIGSLVEPKIPNDNMARRTRTQELAPLQAGLAERPESVGSRVLCRAVVLVLIVCATRFAAPAAGQSADDPLRFGAWLVQDARSLPAALVRRPSTLFGAGLIGVGLVSYRDAEWGPSMQKWHRREAWRVVEEFGDANAMRPAAIMIFVGSLFQNDHRVQDAAFTGLESLILANLLTNGLKAVAGRSRPWQENGADDWEPFGGNTSFPSGHATTAFALMTPWIMYFDHPLAWVSIGIATATSLSRVTLRYHWPSDVLAGAMIGASVSIWLSRRHQRSTNQTGLATRTGDRMQVDPIMGPSLVGMRLTF